MLLSRDGKLYLAMSLKRIINVVDFDTGEDLYTVGRSKTFIGAFMAITGMAFDKNDDLIVSDSAMQSVQVFSKDDGSYMYHIGDKKAVPDPASKNQRPLVKKLNYPSAINLDKKGRLWIHVGGSRAFIVREYIGDRPWDSTIDVPEGECK